MYEEGISIKLESISSVSKYRKGLWIPEDERIEVYVRSIESKKDFHLTLIHELLHAKGELYKDNQGKEKDIIAMEKYTYEKNPKVADFIIDFYKIDVPKEFR